MDAACLRSLDNASELPIYISVESECLGDDGDVAGSDPLETLRDLARLGFDRFKLVDQLSLIVLEATASLYRVRPFLWERVACRLGMRQHRYYDYLSSVEKNRAHIAAAHTYTFPQNSSGPFGPDLAGRWLDAAAAERTLIKHRRDYFRMSGATKHGFWCDWHATRSETTPRESG
jgi:hypothetical protein